MTATDAATDAVADVAEEISDHAQQFADVARGVDGGGVGRAVGALLLGAGIGGGLGYFLAKRQLETKYSKIADAEIAEMREHYIAKARAHEAEVGKGDLQAIVIERGYSTAEPEVSAAPPMAVQPPKAVLAAEDEAAGEPTDDSAMAEDDVEGANGVKPTESRNIFRDARTEEFVWDIHAERRRRSPDAPYVIHYDERFEIEGYNEVSLTYYEADDVLCGEHDEVIDQDRRDRTVGEKNLERFGHGSNDAAIVFVRNDELEIVYEIIRSPNAYAEEVHGFSHGAWDSSNVERMRARERDAPEE